jgi:hypothetical protein
MNAVVEPAAVAAAYVLFLRGRYGFHVARVRTSRAARMLRFENDTDDC